MVSATPSSIRALWQRKLSDLLRKSGRVRGRAAQAAIHLDVRRLD